MSTTKLVASEPLRENTGGPVDHRRLQRPPPDDALSLDGMARSRPGNAAGNCDEASSALTRMEQNSSGQSALFSLIGHKGDLMLVHFRESFDELNRAELQLAQLRLSEYGSRRPLTCR